MRTSLSLDFLFPRTRQAVLSAFVLEPERRWYLSDLARHLNLTPSSLQRELASFTKVGLLRRAADGNRVYYAVEPSFPLLPELTSLLLKTSGIVPAIADALKPFEEQIQFAFVFGSAARGEQTARSDFDLMLIGQVQMVALSLSLRELQKQLGREVNAALYTLTQYKQKRQGGSHFLEAVERDAKLWVKGNQNELAKAVERTEDTASCDD